MRRRRERQHRQHRKQLWRQRTERNAPSEIDGWLWCQDLWLIKNFPYVARAFFGLRQHFVLPGIVVVVLLIFRFPFRSRRPLPCPRCRCSILSYFPCNLSSCNCNALQRRRRASEKKKNVSWVYS